MYPHARQEKLLVQEVGGELVVYDQERDRAHRLNRTTALVWQHCDGDTSVAQLAALLATELGLPAEEELVWLALEQLQKAHLLEQPLGRSAGRVSRREVMRKLALAGGLGLLLPVVSSISAPTPAMAQYDNGNGGNGGDGGNGGTQDWCCTLTFGNLSENFCTQTEFLSFSGGGFTFACRPVASCAECR